MPNIVVRYADAEQSGTIITINGHGHGHFRGMGQWGAYGYALNGMNARQIIAHYYGGTSIAKIPERFVNIHLTKESNVKVYSPSGERVGYYRISPGYAVELKDYQAIVTRGCSNDIVRIITIQPGEQVFSAEKTTESARTMLRFCSDHLPYRGGMLFLNGKVYNTLSMQDYLRSVVPAEMPAQWADKHGFEALKAQAIAARSYAVAMMKRWGALRDTDESQMYVGIHSEDPRGDRAVIITRGLIVQRHGQVMLTEYSSSTGGKTVGGLFPSVLDAGDIISPYHNWSIQISSVEIEQKFGYSNIVGVAPAQLGPPKDSSKVIFITGDGNGIPISAANFAVRLHLPSAWIDPPSPSYTPRE